MKIVVIGSTGTIGAAVVRALGHRHEVVGASRHGTPAVDLEDHATLAELFRSRPDIDAVISCAGSAAFKPIHQLTDADYAYSFRSKLMGQVQLIRAALSYLKDGGSVTVTSGVLAQKPMLGSGAVSLVNAGLEGFVRVAALEAARDVRVNVVSPPWVKETLEKLKMDPTDGLSADDVAKAYVAAVEGKYQGQTLDPARFLGA
jgi:NAD(P)-dependent dehydrogenase (short-subunit alcohol dehydrogenase family)